MSVGDPIERGVTTITTTPQQALSGIEIGAGPRIQCSACHRSVGEASEIAVRAHRCSDVARWSAVEIYCTNCCGEQGTITAPTPGVCELVVTGRVVLRGDATTQTHRLAFHPDDGRDAVLDYCGPEAGTAH